jgi:hypothetical protein
MRRLLSSLSFVILLPLAGCEEGPVRPSDPVTVTFSGTAATQGLSSHTFTSDRRGIATAVLTWSTGAVDLDLYATAAPCGNPFACERRVTSEAINTTTEIVTFGVDDDEDIILWVFNFAGAAQGYSISLTLE